MNQYVIFIGFLIFIALVLLLDLGVFTSKKKRQAHAVSFKEAGTWTFVWVMLAVGFYFLLRYFGHELHGITNQSQLEAITATYQHPISYTSSSFLENISIYRNNLALEFITGYLIEYALSIDNIFVIILIFIEFGVEKKYYQKVLFWGIFGAIVMRFIFIFLSASLIQRFEWILYIFGAMLIFTGIKMFLSRNKADKIETKNHPIVKFVSKYFSVYHQNVRHFFFVRNKGKLNMTPLFLVLLVIEFSDLIFAVDSVPAVLSISKDPFVVFFSNIFAIIGLRSLFFLIVNVMGLFRFLKIGLSILLTFIGCKMIFAHYLKDMGFTTMHSLLVILTILVISIVASVIFPEKKKIA